MLPAPTAWPTIGISNNLATYAVGTVMAEALIVDPIGRNTYADCGIWSDAHVPALKRIVDFLHRQGSLAAAQLHHCGPKASRRRPWQGLGRLDAEDTAKGKPPWQPVSASAEASLVGWLQPRSLTIEEIRKLVEDYRQSSRRAAEADFNVLEIHGAHDYLLHTFLSPIANRRRDAYGGDINGRMRLALEIAERVRTAWPLGKPLFFPHLGGRLARGSRCGPTAGRSRTAACLRASLPLAGLI